MQSVYLKVLHCGATRGRRVRLAHDVNGAKNLIIDPEFSGTSIVVVGSFNPAIFHPSWLISCGVEPNVDSESIKVDVVHQEVSRFDVDGTSYFVNQDRLQVLTESAPWVHILDKVSRIVLELLPHTPLRAFGINRDVHFRVRSPEARIELGRKLVPLEPWGEFGAQIAGQPPSDPGGLLSLTLRGAEKDGDFSVTKNVRVEPSAKIQQSDGIYMQANFHYQGPDDGASSEQVSRKLQDKFQFRINEAESIFEQIMRIS
ncbi:hypothetical protein GYB14_19195 [bacterium]|nr:hypothetical protein [bacterium]